MSAADPKVAISLQPVTPLGGPVECPSSASHPEKICGSDLLPAPSSKDPVKPGCQEGFRWDFVREITVPV